MLKNKLKSILVKTVTATVLAIAPLIAMGGVSYATAVGGTINWEGNGADSVKACDTGQTPYLHWIFTTGGGDVTSATLTVGGNATGGGPMDEHSDNGTSSWTLNTGYTGTAAPTTNSVTASVAYVGSVGQGANLVISDGCFGSGGEGGGPTDVCVNIEGVQTQVPSGMVVDNKGNCTTPTNNTTNTTTQVLGATTGGQGAAQVAVVPQGSVNGGGGAASSTVSKASAIGLVGSLLSAGAGLALLNRRQG